MASLTGPECFVVGGCPHESIVLWRSASPTPSSSSTASLSSLPPTTSAQTSSSITSPIAPAEVSINNVSKNTPACSNLYGQPFVLPSATPSAAPVTRQACQCTSTAAIVGITIAAAATASVFTMLLLLYLTRRGDRRFEVQQTRDATSASSVALILHRLHLNRSQILW